MKLHVPISLRWSDLDAYGHVNNAEMLRLLEEARIQAFWATDEADAPAVGADTTVASMAVLDGRPGAATLTLIARQEIEYLAPVPYLRQPIDVRLWLGKLGGASLDVCYEVWSPAGVLPEVLFARANTTIVLVDAQSERPRRINDVERDAWTPYLDEPMVFARR
ncbi:acyl-CoA thioesterase [Cryobacterium melibiosiphilum]|uniref:Acyl-CoA thioesterase n=1 Tax=Cryobacterium melibiosiphilum TaxID=995039 RepID=A0A3A5MGU9_9MICO|nr:thioesterase family protein [Cryobacterium melibiosiphilum]RJT84621.1 acyl-CoA thioesterase [Cryobacterium melibiosiphilum]